MRHSRTRLHCFALLFAALFLAGCSLNPNPGLNVTPSSVTLRAGASQQFSVISAESPQSPTSSRSPQSSANLIEVSRRTTLPGNSPVSASTTSWSVNGVPGGNSTYGTIDANGLYTAPSSLPPSDSFEITATSATNSRISGNATVALENPVPVLASVSPTTIPVGAFTVTATGSKFVKNAQIIFGGTALPTTFVSSTQLTASGNASAGQAGTMQISVRNPDPGSATSAQSLSVLVQAADVVHVTVSPTQASLRPGANQQFSAAVSGTTNASVTWLVNGIAGGNSTLGVITAGGLYTAPATPPGGAVTVAATSMADSRSSSTASLTLENPIPVLTSVSPSPITVGNFSLTVTGSNFVNGATVVFGGSFIPTQFVSSTQLTATGTALSAQVGAVPVAVQNPDPGSAASSSMNVQVNAGTSAVSATAAARFLEQSTWGPTPQSIAHVQQIGFQAFLNEQFSAPASTYSQPGPKDDLSFVQKQFFAHAVNGPDQLRQRVSFALSEIFVISGVAISDPNAFVLWMNMMQNDAWGNHATLLKDVTLSPAMGSYLNMANNDGCNGCRPNENYGREVLQLFTIGLAELNPDGTPQLDGSGIPIPTYTQTTVTGFAAAFTGWTYPATPGQPAQFYDAPYYSGPMIPFDSNHNSSAKTLLNNTVLPAGGGAQTDLDAALQNIFNHPNVGPFLAKQLIQKLVTSNPSPDYVSRVANIFNDNGSGVRGDLKAVVSAILMDPEARRGDDPTQLQAGDGHLKEPLLHILNMLRAVNTTTDGGNYIQYYAANMGQYPFYPPSVFNFYPPSYIVPGTQLLGPEFKLLNSSTTVARINFVNDLIYGNVGPNTKIYLSQYVALAGDVNKLLDSISAVMLHGQMASDMRATLVTALTGITDPTERTQAAFYLIGGSSQYQVQH
ncbi:MAG: DUF1800 family protein [Acidobacteriales bacterium]|nr:DUF1800 family protein [Terriglobales bacterium]